MAKFVLIYLIQCIGATMMGRLNSAKKAAVGVLNYPVGSSAMFTLGTSSTARFLDRLGVPHPLGSPTKKLIGKYQFKSTRPASPSDTGLCDDDDVENYLALLKSMGIVGKGSNPIHELTEYRIGKQIEMYNSNLVCRDSIPISKAICIYPGIVVESSFQGKKRIDARYNPLMPRDVVASGWVQLAEAATRQTARNSVERMVQVYYKIVEGCRVGRGAAEPSSSLSRSKRFENVCYPPTLSNRTPATSLERNALTVCSAEVKNNCISALEKNVMPEDEIACSEAIKNCISALGPRCLTESESGSVSLETRQVFEAVTTDHTRIGYRKDFLLESIKRASEALVREKKIPAELMVDVSTWSAENNLLSKLTPETEASYLLPIREDCRMALLSVLYTETHLVAGYIQGMFDTCTYFRGFLGLGPYDTITVVNFLFNQVTREYRFRSYRHPMYTRVLYSYLRLVLEDSVLGILDRVDQDYVALAGEPERFARFGGQSLSYFLITFGARSLADPESSKIRASYMLPVWNLLFHHGRPGLLALFLGGIEMNTDMINEIYTEYTEKVESDSYQDKLVTIEAMAKIVSDPLRRILDMEPAPSDSGKCDDQQESFTLHVEMIVSRYIAHAAEVLQRPRFVSLMKSLDPIVEDIIARSHYDLSITGPP